MDETQKQNSLFSSILAVLVILTALASLLSLGSYGADLCSENARNLLKHYVTVDSEVLLEKLPPGPKKDALVNALGLNDILIRDYGIELKIRAQDLNMGHLRAYYALSGTKKEVLRESVSLDINFIRNSRKAYIILFTDKRVQQLALVIDMEKVRDETGKAQYQLVVYYQGQYQKIPLFIESFSNEKLDFVEGKRFELMGMYSVYKTTVQMNQDLTSELIRPPKTQSVLKNFILSAKNYLTDIDRAQSQLDLLRSDVKAILFGLQNEAKISFQFYKNRTSTFEELISSGQENLAKNIVESLANSYFYLTHSTRQIKTEYVHFKRTEDTNPQSLWKKLAGIVSIRQLSNHIYFVEQEGMTRAILERDLYELSRSDLAALGTIKKILGRIEIPKTQVQICKEHLLKLDDMAKKGQLEAIKLELSKEKFVTAQSVTDGDEIEFYKKLLQSYFQLFSRENNKIVFPDILDATLDASMNAQIINGTLQNSGINGSARIVAGEGFIEISLPETLMDFHGLDYLIRIHEATHVYLALMMHRESVGVPEETAFDKSAARYFDEAMAMSSEWAFVYLLPDKLRQKIALRFQDYKGPDKTEFFTATLEQPSHSYQENIRRQHNIGHYNLDQITALYEFERRLGAQTNLNEGSDKVPR